jgi:glycerophosphoryl diester phosphodiesterase
VRYHTLVIAHRGASSECPENTLSAYRAAIASGVDVIELDVQQAREGALVAIHDATVDRTTDGRGRVRDLTVPELQALDAGAWLDRRFARERIPTFDQVLQLVVGTPVSLCIEIKAGNEQEGQSTALAAANLIRARRAERAAVVYVEWPSVVSVLKTACPCLAVGLDAETGKGQKAWNLIRQVLLSGANFLAHPHYSLNARIVGQAHRHGLGVWAWTVDEPADWKKMLDLSVDGIMTNRPSQLRAWLDNL